jgi:transcriptional regulator with XRE-family HTH domain
LDLPRRFGARVRELRISRNLSREKLSERIGIGVAAYGRIERGERMNARILQRLAHELGVEVKDLFDFHAPTPPPTGLSAEALKIAFLVDSQSKADPSFARRILRIIEALTRD